MLRQRPLAAAAAAARPPSLLLLQRRTALRRRAAPAASNRRDVVAAPPRGHDAAATRAGGSDSDAHHHHGQQHAQQHGGGAHHHHGQQHAQQHGGGAHHHAAALGAERGHPKPGAAGSNGHPHPQHSHHPPQQHHHLAAAETAAATAAAAGDEDAADFPAAVEPLAPPAAGGAGPLARLLAKLPHAAHAATSPGRIRGLVLLNIMTLVMATNWSVLKVSDSATLTDATIFMALRFIIASALFIPFLRPHPKIWKAGLQIGAWYSAGYITQALALSQTAASRASLLSTFTVLAVPIIAGLGGAHIRPIVWACAAAALLGTGMLTEGSSSLGPANAGDALAVASAVFFAAQIVCAEKSMRSLPPKSELPLIAVSMLTVAAATTAAAAVSHAGDLPAAAAGIAELLRDWGAALPAWLGGGGAPGAAEAAEAARTAQQLFYTAVVSTDMVLFVELVALQEVTSTDAAMIYSMEPVLGALLAYAFLGERWGPWGWAGGGIILAASLLTQFEGATED